MNPVEVVKPNVSETLASDIVFRNYGLKVVSMKRMVSFDDQNFHIMVSKEHHNPYIKSVSDDGYTLKITNTMKSALSGHFDSMHAAMRHLHNKGLPVPVPVNNLDGKSWKLENVPLLNEDLKNSSEAKGCGVHLLTFIPGATISSIKYTVDVLYQWGNLLARFHNAMEDFNCTQMNTKDIFWNLEHIPDLRNFTDCLDENEKKLIHGVLDKYPEEITNNTNNLKKGVIHGDFNENNILIQKKNSTPSEDPTYLVNGILDLEDMHYATYVWDVGVMLAYTLIDCKHMDPLEAAGHALAGYLSLRPLSSLEMSLLKMCAACRISQSLVLCVYSYKTDPGNSYILTSSQTGWNRLEQLWGISNEKLLNMWSDIQKMYCSEA